MQHLIAAVEKSLEDQNWYAALALALTLPDICAKLESPQGGSAKRYSAWANKYFAPKYTSEIGAAREEHVFLSGNDLYALRCAVLHEGSDSTIEQRARESLEKFFLVEPPQDGLLHCNQLGVMLQLQVDILCRDICLSVREWIDELGHDDKIHARIASLMTIHQHKPGEGISF